MLPALMFMYLLTKLGWHIPTNSVISGTGAAQGSVPVLFIHMVQRGATCLFNLLTAATPGTLVGTPWKGSHLENAGIEPATYKGMLSTNEATKQTWISDSQVCMFFHVHMVVECVLTSKTFSIYFHSMLQLISLLHESDQDIQVLAIFRCWPNCVTWCSHHAILDRYFWDNFGRQTSHISEFF